MGLIDTLKGLVGQGSKLAADHKDTIHDGVDKAADFAKDKAGDKHADKVDKASHVVKDTVDKIADSGES